MKEGLKIKLKQPKCNHKLEIIWQEIKGKIFKKSRNGYICLKCKSEFIIDL